MKRLLTSRILACLIFLTIWGSKTYAQGSISSYTAGTETFEITSNTRIPKHDTEYQYYASANISLFIGAKEVWKNPKKIGANTTSVLKEILASNQMAVLMLINKMAVLMLIK